MSDSVVRPSSDEEWETLMHQLHNQPKARPQPFFYTRLHARLTADAAAKSPLFPAWLRRPVYAALLGALVITLSGDGSALRPAVEINQCATCPISR